MKYYPSNLNVCFMKQTTMPRLLFGSFDTKHFHPKLMEFIRDREHMEAIEMIRGAAAEYNPSRLIDNSGSNLLHHAAREGNEVITMYLLSVGFKVNAVDRDGKSPLELAVIGNHVTTSEILIKANANIYAKVSKGNKSLIQAVFDGTIKCYSHIIEMFLKKMMAGQSDPKKLAKSLAELKCPLYYIVDLKNPLITRIVLEKGCATIDARESRHGNTALHRAVYFKDTEHVKLLLAHGADVNVKDKSGRIPWRCITNIKGSIVHLKILKMLLKRKPAFKSFTANGRMQMYELFVRGSENAVKMVLRSDVDFTGKDGKGDTVFHYLAMNKNLSGAKLLPDKSYDVDLRNQARLTALHVAAMNGNCGAIKFLLNNGARVDMKTRSTGRTSLFCAVRSSWSKCVEVLLERGADLQLMSQKRKTVLDMVQNRDDPVASIVLAHLAMLEARGTTITPAIRAKIDSCESYKSRLAGFERQLQDMKNDKIDDSLTMFELLVGQTEDIVKRVGADQLKLQLERLSNNDSYYSDWLRKRINRAINIIDLFE